MSYSQEVTLKLTIKGTLNGMKTIINTRDLNKLLDTAEGRATLLDKGRFEMREVSHARTMDASPEASFIDLSHSMAGCKDGFANDQLTAHSIR